MRQQDYFLVSVTATKTRSQKLSRSCLTPGLWLQDIDDLPCAQSSLRRTS